MKLLAALLCLMILCTGCTENVPEAAEKAAFLAIGRAAPLSGQAVTWGPGTAFDEENRPAACLELQQKYGGLGALFLMPEEGGICLTFDEGYENGYTAAILDTLKEKDVRAIFFVTYPYVRDNPELIRRMIDEGHAVGNHTKSHPSLPGLPNEQAKEEIEYLHRVLEEEYGYTMRLLRPPKGEFSEKTLALAQELGYQTMLWSFAYADWNVESQPEAGEALQKITSRIHPGAIYLLHAVSKTNSAVLGEAIDAFRAAGYELILPEGC